MFAPDQKFRKMQKLMLVELPVNELEAMIVNCVNACLRTHEGKKTLTEPENMEQLITKKEAAKLLSVHVSTIDNLRRDGSLTRYNIGKSARFKRGDIYELANKRKAS